MRIVKDRSSMKIDAAVAAVIAHDIAQRSDGPSVYESTGLFSLGD